MTQTEKILVVEDSPEDFEVLQRALKKADIHSPIFRCKDGDEALDFLYERGEYEGSDSTVGLALVLLDLNLPGLDGREVLRAVKGDPALRSLPVIVFTTSNDEKDITQCYADGANSYIQKPLEPGELVKMMVYIKNFWLETAKLPEINRK